MENDTRTGKSKTRVVYEDHDRFGLYLWKMPNGQFVGDSEGNFLNIAAMYGSIEKIARLRQVVALYGISEGEPVFFPGHRRVTDAEYEDQQARLQAGLTPDPDDLGVIKDELRQRKQYG